MQMRYKSTRNSQLRLEASQVIAQGISEEGGLFVPECFPDLTGELPALAQLDYSSLAKRIFQLFLTDFSENEIASCVEQAYTKEKFGGSHPVKLVPLTDLGEDKYLLELWHGPTCAFKDMALQILPHFLATSLKKVGGGKQAVILTATSGDTGKAALEGFKNVLGTRILVFYPRDGVSPTQKRQMVTQEGNNVGVCAIEGNFDDAQTGVKKIFTDPELKAALDRHDMLFSSANSINWGRLLPQIVYYFDAYLELYRQGKLESLSAPMDVVVPTGNFGNILAAYYAKTMGLPIRKLVCASNANNVLTDFIRTGTYDRRREFYATTSPSMDILVSSNLERLLYALAGENSDRLSKWMESLAEFGVYTVEEDVKEKVQELFFGGFCNDQGSANTIQELMEKEHYLCDPHTAVAVDVYRQYREASSSPSVPTVIASTASPYKFSASVLSALGKTPSGEDFDNLLELETLSHTEAPEQLKALQGKPERFSKVIPKEQAAAYVLEALGIGGC